MLQAQDTFSWDGKPLENLKSYTMIDPERGPTVVLFGDTVSIFITQARLGVHEYIRDMPKMISSLRDASGLSQEGEGKPFTFGDWIPAIGVVLTHRTCQMIGAQVCYEEGFTIEEAERLIREFPLPPTDQDAYGWIGNEEE